MWYDFYLPLHIFFSENRDVENCSAKKLILDCDQHLKDSDKSEMESKSYSLFENVQDEEPKDKDKLVYSLSQSGLCGVMSLKDLAQNVLKMCNMDPEILPNKKNNTKERNVDNCTEFDIPSTIAKMQASVNIPNDLESREALLKQNDSHETSEEDDGGNVSERKQMADFNDSESSSKPDEKDADKDEKSLGNNTNAKDNGTYFNFQYLNIMILDYFYSFIVYEI